MVFHWPMKSWTATPRTRRTEGVSGQDRKAIWQGQTHVGDGSRHSDRGSVGRDAKFKTPIHYLVGSPRGRLTQLEKAFLTKPWEDVRESVRVKLIEHGEETYVFVTAQDGLP